MPLWQEGLVKIDLPKNKKKGQKSKVTLVAVNASAYALAGKQAVVFDGERGIAIGDKVLVPGAALAGVEALAADQKHVWAVAGDPEDGNLRLIRVPLGGGEVEVVLAGLGGGRVWMALGPDAVFLSVRSLDVLLRVEKAR
jgi:hypothetical protein